jgi:hypothetical protein
MCKYTSESLGLLDKNSTVDENLVFNPLHIPPQSHETLQKKKTDASVGSSYKGRGGSLLHLHLNLTYIIVIGLKNNLLNPEREGR